MTIDFKDEMKKSAKELNDVIDTETDSTKSKKKELGFWKVCLLMLVLSFGFLFLGVFVIILMERGLGK